jgi:hypothetical protein
METSNWRDATDNHQGDTIVPESSKSRDIMPEGISIEDARKKKIVYVHVPSEGGEWAAPEPEHRQRKDEFVYRTVYPKETPIDQMDKNEHSVSEDEVREGSVSIYDAGPAGDKALNDGITYPEAKKEERSGGTHTS